MMIRSMRAHRDRALREVFSNQASRLSVQPSDDGTKTPPAPSKVVTVKVNPSVPSTLSSKARIAPRRKNDTLEEDSDEDEDTNIDEDEDDLALQMLCPASRFSFDVTRDDAIPSKHASTYSVPRLQNVYRRNFPDKPVPNIFNSHNHRRRRGRISETELFNLDLHVCLPLLRISDVV